MVGDTPIRTSIRSHEPRLPAFTGPMACDGSLNLSKPLFSHLEMGIGIEPTSRGYEI